MKKRCLSLFFLVYSFLLFAQPARRFTAIDNRSRSIGYLPLSQLTKKLIAPYSDEEDKTRAIFSWIAYHIRYDDDEYKKGDALRYDRYKYGEVMSKEQRDSLCNIEYANFALKNHKGICGEYAGLFKAMCDVAAIKCEVVLGYGKWYSSIGKPYKEDHAWNAVFFKEQWHLLDVTWASGFFDEKKQKSKQQFNPFYFCTAPELFYNDHFPALLKWSLLSRPISREQFEKAIYFNYDDQNKIKVDHIIPKIGFLKKKIGDSISFEMEPSVKITRVNLNLNDEKEGIYYLPFPEPVVISNGEKQPVETKAKSGSLKVSHSVTIKDKAVSAKEAQNINSIMNFLDTVPMDTLRKMAHDEKVSASTSKMEIEKPENNGIRYFKKAGSKISFKYYIQEKGDFVIWISLNDENLMAFRLVVE